MTPRAAAGRASRRWAMLSLLALALARGGLYALLLPPWGLLDEEQHVHYIQHLAERRAIPVVGQTYLSPEIANAIFAARRWETFHWVTPPSADPRTWGLEGHSYEGYQPPAFYALLAPLYLLLPADILLIAFALRWAVVGLSLVTVWLAHGLAAELFPRQEWLPLFIALFLISIPERTAAMSRVNNDALLEVVAAAFTWACARAVLHGLTRRRAVLLGLLFALGVWTKLSMGVLAIFFPAVIWRSRGRPGWRSRALWAVGIAAVGIAPLAARNLALYGDVTGFAGFARLAGWPARQFTAQALLAALGDLWRHTWVIWWEGAAVGSSPVLSGFYAVLAILSVLSLIGLARYFRPRLGGGAWPPPAGVLGLGALAGAGYGALALTTYFASQVPVIQGRLLLPALPLLCILFVLGLWHGWRPQVTIPAAVTALLCLDAASLFGHLLPYFYYWSAFVKDGAAQAYAWPGWQAAGALFAARLLADKPPVVQGLAGWLAPVYVLALGFAAFHFWRARREIGEALGQRA